MKGNMVPTSDTRARGTSVSGGLQHPHRSNLPFFLFFLLCPSSHLFSSLPFSIFCPTSPAFLSTFDSSTSQMMHDSRSSSSSSLPPSITTTLHANSGPAPVNLQALAQEITSLVKDDQRIKVAGVDLDGILRGKIMVKSKFLSILESGFGFCSVIFGWDMHDKTYAEELSISNAANGKKEVTPKATRYACTQLNVDHSLRMFYS